MRLLWKLLLRTTCRSSDGDVKKDANGERNLRPRRSCPHVFFFKDGEDSMVKFEKKKSPGSECCC